MAGINIPFRGAARPAACRFETLPEFLKQRASLSLSEQQVVERLLNSVVERPEASGDFLFPNTPVGASHVRHRDGCYIFFQRFNADPPLRYLIRLLWCGRYAAGVAGPRFDFEDDETE